MKREDDWGFDDPTYIMEANMQENVSKAMERIASLRVSFASWQHITEYHGSLDTFVSFLMQEIPAVSCGRWYVF